jgi:hypothetical protein
MRQRRWVWVTVVVIVVVVAGGVGAALVQTGSGSSGSDTTGADAGSQPSASPSGSGGIGNTSRAPGVFQLRQVLFQESGRIQGKPPLRPGPAPGGKHATRDLLRIDCSLKPRPMQDNDNVILCDADGFRYGLGPSALPASPVAAATPSQGADGSWAVTVELDADATPAFMAFTRRLAQFHPPLNQAAVVINGVVVTAPAVSEPIRGNSIQVTGPFSREDAEALAAALAPVN